MQSSNATGLLNAQNNDKSILILRMDIGGIWLRLKRPFIAIQFQGVGCASGMMSYDWIGERVSLII